MSKQHVEAIERALAAGPTPGPWHWHEDENMYPVTEDEHRRRFGPPNYNSDGREEHVEAVIQTDSGYYGPDNPTRAYIAAANPEALRAILDRLAELERSNEAMRHQTTNAWLSLVESPPDVMAARKSLAEAVECLPTAPDAADRRNA